MKRGTITWFIDRHLLAWEIGMGVLALIYVGLTILDDGDPGSVPLFVLISFSVVFITEFAVRWWDAPSRRAYLRQYWLNGIASIPFVGALRLLRLLQLAHIIRAARGVRVSAQRKHRRESDAIWFLFPSVILFWVSSAAAIWLLEHDVNPKLRTFGDALYWAFLTATTVGHGTVQAVTADGQVLTGVVTFVSVGLIGVASSRLTALWLNEYAEESADETAKELRELRHEIAELRIALLPGGGVPKDHPDGDQLRRMPTELSPEVRAEEMGRRDPVLP